MSDVGTLPWMRCYRCWSTALELHVHYDGIHRIDPTTGTPVQAVEEQQEAIVQCLDCMHDQPHLLFSDGQLVADESRWERLVMGTPWVASCTITVPADDVDVCSGPEAGEALSYAALGDAGTQEFFSHVRFHTHQGDQIVAHLLVELYARSGDEAGTVLEESARGPLVITSLAEESRPPAVSSGGGHA
jgi:hypothetical protein